MSDEDKTAELEAEIAKQSERIGELSKENAKWRRMAQGKDLTPEAQQRIEQLEQDVEKHKAEAAEAKKAAAKASKDLEGATKRASEVEAREQRLLVDNGLNEALAKANVTNPHLSKAAKAVLAAQVQVIAEGETRVVKIGDKSLADFVTAWAGSDEGKHFVTAPNNEGGGSQGGRGNSNNTTGNLGGTPAERVAAIKARFPDLST